MIKIENENIIKKIYELNKSSNMEELRLNLYSILTALLLSTDVFKRNIDIIEFLTGVNLTFSPYVFKSRTLIMARVLRKIEEADDEKLDLYKKYLLENIKSTEMKNKTLSNKPIEKKPTREDKYIDDILNKYSRRKG